MSRRNRKTKHKRTIPYRRPPPAPSVPTNTATNVGLLSLLRESLPNTVGGLIAQAIVTIVSLLYTSSGTWSVVLIVELGFWLICLFFAIKRPTSTQLGGAAVWTYSNLRLTARVGLLVIPLFTASCALSLQFWQGNATLVNSVLLTIVVIAGWLGYLWIVLSKLPASHSRNNNASTVQTRYYPKWLRRLILVVVLFNTLVPLTSVAIFFWPPSNIVILVADFDGPEPEKYRVTETVVDRLQRALRPYNDVQVRTLGHAVPKGEGSSAARIEGEKQKATIVIWGWYGTTTPPLLSVHFELLRSPKEFPQLGPAVQGAVQVIDSARLDSPSLQIQLSSEMAYLSLFTVGMTRYAAEDWDEAIKRFTDALSQVEDKTIITDKTWALLYRGNSYLSKENYDRAITDYNQIIKINSNNADAYVWRGLAFARKTDYPKAISDYNQALVLRPNDTNAYNSRGNAYFYMDEYDKAIADYTKVIEMDANYVIAYYNRANTYLEKHDYDKAIADSTQALKIHPDYVMYYSQRGDTYLKMGNCGLAISDFNQAIRYQADSYNEVGILFEKRGEGYFCNKDYNHAIMDYNKAISLDPDEIAFFNRGNAYFVLGNYERAIVDFSEAIHRTPVYDIVMNAGNKESQGDMQELGRLPVNDDKVAKFYYGRGLAYIQKGDKTKAVEDFRTILKLRNIRDVPDWQFKAKEQLNILGVK